MQTNGVDHDESATTAAAAAAAAERVRVGGSDGGISRSLISQRFARDVAAKLHADVSIDDVLTEADRREKLTIEPEQLTQAIDACSETVKLLVSATDRSARAQIAVRIAVEQLVTTTKIVSYFRANNAQYPRPRAPTRLLPAPPPPPQQRPTPRRRSSRALPPCRRLKRKMRNTCATIRSSSSCSS